MIVLVHYAVNGPSKSIITSETRRISDLTKCDLVGEICDVCQSLLTLCMDCGRYSKMENDNVNIHCVKCGIAMLEYQHEQGN